MTGNNTTCIDKWYIGLHNECEAKENVCWRLSYIQIISNFVGIWNVLYLVQDVITP